MRVNEMKTSVSKPDEALLARRGEMKRNREGESDGRQSRRERERLNKKRLQTALRKRDSDKHLRGKESEVNRVKGQAQRDNKEYRVDCREL